ncbi:unnamed protein product [Adineta steineri]|uniref:Uncharacterized protein n=1 Tax=Adineta steineri TaxID=433720 RepID=A0A815GCY2_9BILA|nr:unnamed protein product [Adineta steineri]CAF1385667.1 unnamed protein product [Adineta steineri]
MTDNQQQQIDLLNNDIQILQKKLDSKTKAFGILINELESLRHERDQFKTLADSLQEKCVQLRKPTINKIEPLNAIHHSQTLYEHPNDSTIHLLKTALKTVQDEKEGLQSKIDELQYELNDVKGDLSIFRQKRNRDRNNSNNQYENNDKELDNHREDQSILLNHLEQSNERINELHNDLKLITCEKEELEIERDSFKIKYNKLNQELNKMLNGNEKCIVDIELVLSENRYLKEKIIELTREKSLAIANANKYKDLIQTQRSAFHRQGKIQSSGDILTYNQVRSVINQSYILPNNPETDNDLRSIAEALFENIKDKNVTIIHQRKINKLLASRIIELEKRLTDCKLTTTPEQTSSLINLLDRTPSPLIPDSTTSQIIDSTDDIQQLSSTQIFDFPSTWSTSSSFSSLSMKTSENDSTNKNKHNETGKHRNQSQSNYLEMDDLLESSSSTSNSSNLIPPTTSDDIEQLQDLFNNNNARHSTKQTNSTTVSNLTC